MGADFKLYKCQTRVTPYRSAEQARSLFHEASKLGTPSSIVTDRLPSYNVPTKLFFPDAKHIKVKSFADDITNNVIESFNNRFKAWYKTKRGFRDFDSANAMIAVFVFFFNFIRPHQGLNGLTPAQVDDCLVQLTTRKPKTFLQLIKDNLIESVEILINFHFKLTKPLFRCLNSISAKIDFFIQNSDIDPLIKCCQKLSFDRERATTGRPYKRLNIQGVGAYLRSPVRIYKVFSFKKLAMFSWYLNTFIHSMNLQFNCFSSIKLYCVCQP